MIVYKAASRIRLLYTRISVVLAPTALPLTRPASMHSASACITPRLGVTKTAGTHRSGGCAKTFPTPHRFISNIIYKFAAATKIRAI